MNKQSGFCRMTLALATAALAFSAPLATAADPIQIAHVYGKTGALRPTRSSRTTG